MRFLLLFLCCSTSVAADLEFGAGSANYRLAGMAHATVENNGVEKSGNTPDVRFKPMTGFGVLGAVDAFTKSQDAAEDGATSLAKASPAAAATTFAAGQKRLTADISVNVGTVKNKCTSPPNPTDVCGVAHAAGYAEVNRKYVITDPNKGSLNLAKGEISFTIVRSPSDTVGDAYLEGRFDDSFVKATHDLDHDNGDGTTGAWKIVKRLRLSSGTLVEGNPQIHHLCVDRNGTRCTSSFR